MDFWLVSKLVNLNEILAISKNTLNIFWSKHGHASVIHKILEGHIEAQKRHVRISTYVGWHFALEIIAINNHIIIIILTPFYEDDLTIWEYNNESTFTENKIKFECLNIIIKDKLPQPKHTKKHFCLNSQLTGVTSPHSN